MKRGFSNLCSRFSKNAVARILTQRMLAENK